TGGAWIFYFADAPTLLGDLIAGQASFYAYATIALLTATTYVFGGILREQVCTYICPWPRIQGAMLDEDSLTVTYNDWRGEPRSRHAKKARAQGLAVGDCVDCNACVAVCPMGIDIRDGQQMECITCALCIDACDVVMRKTGREQGLIAYATLRDYNDNVARAQAATPPSNAHTVGPRNATTATPLLDFDPARVRGADGALQPGFKSTTLRSFVRPRTLIYTVIWGAIGLALLTALLIRDRLDVNVLRDRNPVYVVLSNGDVRNGYEIKVLNMMPRLRSFTLGIDGLPGGFMTLAGSNGPPTKQLALAVAADRLRSVRVYVRVPRANLTAKQTPFDFVVKEIDGRETARYAARFDAPERR
ncbi:MAG: cytochrome c oxidase accessory protein CcoG, partial [Pseudomonadota bacterium]